MIEIDLESRCGSPADAAAIRRSSRPWRRGPASDPDVAPRHRQRDHAGLIDRGDERRRAAVHDRHFRSVDLDDGVVDAEPDSAAKHMLGGRDERAGGIAEYGGEFGGCDGADSWRAISRSVSPSPRNAQTRCRCRLPPDARSGGRRTGMHANAGDGGLVAQRGLPAGLHAPRHASFEPDRFHANLPWQPSLPLPENAKAVQGNLVNRSRMSGQLAAEPPPPNSPVIPHPRRINHTGDMNAANSRFLTECYRCSGRNLLSAYAPKSDRLCMLRIRRASRKSPAAGPARISNPPKSTSCLRSAERPGWRDHCGPPAADRRQGRSATRRQFACRRRKAGISSWSVAPSYAQASAGHADRAPAALHAWHIGSGSGGRPHLGRGLGAFLGGGLPASGRSVGTCGMGGRW